MIAYLKHNLKTLFSPILIVVLFIYLSFAWFLSSPPLNNTVVYNSQKIILQYELILFSLIFFNFILFIILHFQEELKSEFKQIIGTKLSKNQIVWGLFLSYYLFFFFGFIVPAYATAFIQQLLYSPHSISFSIYYIRGFSLLFSFYPFWIIIVLWLYLKLQNDFTVLILITFLYLITILASLFSGYLFFDNLWLSDMLFGQETVWRIIIKLLFWILFLSFTYFIGRETSNKILLNYLKPYTKGIFSRIANKTKAYLSMHHLDMMGLDSQKVLSIFTFFGLLLILMLLHKPNTQLIVMGKVYIGAFLPILFSFNQYYLFKIDINANMVHNNFLRKKTYSTIIINRWLLLLIPQIIILLVFGLIISFFGRHLSYGLIFYMVLLNIFCSLINLFFSVLTKTNGIANIFLISIVYLQLRSDVQNLILNNKVLSFFNIFHPLLQKRNETAFSYWIVVIISIIGLLYLTINLIKRLKFQTL